MAQAQGTLSCADHVAEMVYIHGRVAKVQQADPKLGHLRCLYM